MQPDALMDRLSALEHDKVILQLVLSKLQTENRHTVMTEDEIREVFAYILNELSSGNLQSVKQIIDTHVQVIEV